MSLEKANLAKSTSIKRVGEINNRSKCENENRTCSTFKINKKRGIDRFVKIHFAESHNFAKIRI